MKTLSLVSFLIFLSCVPAAQGQMIVETPVGERRLRYQVCETEGPCRMVEETLSYPLCDEHHNCQIVDASASGTSKIWEEEQLVQRGSFVFMPA